MAGCCCTPRAVDAFSANLFGRHQKKTYLGVRRKLSYLRFFDFYSHNFFQLVAYMICFTLTFYQNCIINVLNIKNIQKACVPIHTLYIQSLISTENSEWTKLTSSPRNPTHKSVQ